MFSAGLSSQTRNKRTTASSAASDAISVKCFRADEISFVVPSGWWYLQDPVTGSRTKASAVSRAWVASCLAVSRTLYPGEGPVLNAHWRTLAATHLPAGSYPISIQEGYSLVIHFLEHVVRVGDRSCPDDMTQ